MSGDDLNPAGRRDVELDARAAELYTGDALLHHTAVGGELVQEGRRADRGDLGDDGSHASFDKADGFSRSGLGLTPAGKVWTVTSVYDGSPAEEAALRVGTIVSAVDGKGPDQFPPDQLREYFRRAPGAKVTLTVREGEKERPVVLTLRDLL